MDLFLDLDHCFLLLIANRLIANNSLSKASPPLPVGLARCKSGAAVSLKAQASGGYPWQKAIFDGAACAGLTADREQVAK
jgi:hypothetical protein